MSKNITHEARIRTIAISADVAALSTVITDTDLIGHNLVKAIDFFNHGDVDVVVTMSGDTGDDAPGVTIPAGSVISFTADDDCAYRVNDIAVTFAVSENTKALQISIEYNFQVS